MLYLNTLYKPHELQQRAGIFYTSAGLSGAFGGLLSSAILKMNGIGGLAGWRWIFILEGIATFTVAVIAVLLLPADLASTSFLTQEEKEFAVARHRSVGTIRVLEPHSTGSSEKVAEDVSSEKGSTGNPDTSVNAQAEDEALEWREVVRGIKDVQVWLTGFSYMGVLVSMHSYAYFLPTIVTGLGYSGEVAQIHTSPPYVAATVLIVLVSVVADRLKLRGPLILILLPISMAGYILAIAAKNNVARYAAVFLISAGVWPCIPCLLSLMSNNMSGHYKRATATAAQLALGNCGSFIANFVYTADQQPHYVRGHSITLAFVVMAWLFMAANMYVHFLRHDFLLMDEHP
ncbi:hypothetical protein EUX98_g5715 [Antrodiella citrinella]|uniref:Major facilitator superfamily (MFS) profile domain-containing protein n=1 Tax=Antrodiella citrinella TaxID=2447956 RepID=A0A4S4MSY5_9APHY|nr:hypothetical protein EUX98_g5715 [Antrodiella citrinella]